MLWGIVGNYGDGKSLYMVLEGFSSDRDIIGNFTLRLDNYSKIKTPFDLKEKGFDKLVLLDEFQFWLSAYVSPSLINRHINNVIDLSRKRDIDVFATTRRLYRLGAVFRDTIDYLVICSRIGAREFPYSYRTDYRDFKYTVEDQYDGSREVFILEYDLAKPYFSYFDSFELIDTLMEEQLDLDVLERTDPIKYNSVLKGIAKDVLKELKDLSHANIQLELSSMGLFLKERHTRKLYVIIKEIIEIRKSTVIKKKQNKSKSYGNEMQFL